MTHTDTSTVILGKRHPRTRAVLLNHLTSLWWGEVFGETADYHEDVANNSDPATREGHTALAVMRRAFDAAEAAGVNVTVRGDLAADGTILGTAGGSTIPDDDPAETPERRAAFHLLREVQGCMDDPAALAALPYPVRDHRVRTASLDEASEAVAAAIDEAAAAKDPGESVAGYIERTVQPDAVPDDDDAPAGEQPPVTAADLARDDGSEVTISYTIDVDRVARAFPPAPATATDIPEEQARKLLEYHTRADAGACHCGWGVWGASFAQHLVATLNGAGLLYGSRERQRMADLQADPTEFNTVKRQRDSYRDELDALTVFRTLRHKALDVLREALPDREPGGLLAGVRELIQQRDDALAEVARLDEWIHRGQVVAPAEGSGAQPLTAPTDPGLVAYRVEVTPHNPGEHGEAYESGDGTPAMVVDALLAVAMQVESFPPPPVKPAPSPLMVALAENINSTVNLWVQQLNAATARTRAASSALTTITDTTPEPKP